MFAYLSIERERERERDRQKEREKDRERERDREREKETEREREKERENRMLPPGLKPGTSRLLAERSNQLSYKSLRKTANSSIVILLRRWDNSESWKKNVKTRSAWGRPNRSVIASVEAQGSAPTARWVPTP